MRIGLENIGKVRKADIELDAITVIAGENNTGKSTVGKALYAVFNSFYDIEKKIEQSRINTLARSIKKSHDSHYINSFIESMRLSADLIKQKISIDEIDNYVSDYTDQFPFGNDTDDEEMYEFVCEPEFISEVTEAYNNVVNVDDIRVYHNIFNGNIYQMFNSAIVSKFEPTECGKIILGIRDTEFTMNLKRDKVENISRMLSLNTEIIYIDDPFVLDTLGSEYNRRNIRLSQVSTGIKYRDHLISKLTGKMTDEVDAVFNQIIIDDELREIMNILNSVCDGELFFDKNEYKYRSNDGNDSYRIGDISTGLKTFVILKSLLTNGSLEKNGTIILDEPEIHLHPAWQLILAEIIVLLQKKFSLHILINTHSPYFLRAVEVFAARYRIADKCRYYMTADNSGITDIVDVSTKTELIFEKLAAPLERLQQMEYRND